jgi:hypothetical protein
VAGSEDGYLKAFDAMRDRIHEMADKVYTRVGKGPIVCILEVEDF